MSVQPYGIIDIGIPKAVRLVQQTTNELTSRMRTAVQTMFFATALGVMAIGFIGFAMSFFAGLAAYQSIISVIAVIVVISYLVFGLIWLFRSVIRRG